MPTVANIETVKLSGPKRVDLQVYRGDSGMFRITVKVPDPLDPDTLIPFDISTAEWDADIRLKADDTTVLGNFTVTPVVGAVEKIDVILPADLSKLLPKNCAYDVEMTMGDEVITLVYGVIVLTKDVSRP